MALPATRLLVRAVTKPITPKQQRFVEEYLVDCNGTQAAIRAGYSARTANVQASQLLAKLSIQEAIQAARAERARRVEQSTGRELSPDRVLKEYLDLAFNDLRDCFEQVGDTLKIKHLKDWPESIGRSLAAVKVKRHIEGRGEDAREVEVIEFKLHDKLNALEKLARHLGLLKDDAAQGKPTIVTLVAGIDLQVLVGGKPGLPHNTVAAVGEAYANPN